MDLHPVTLGVLLGDGVGADVEAYDDGPGGGGQHHVGFADGPHRPVDDPDTDLVAREFLQRLAHRLHRALDIGLDDDGQFQHLLLGDVLEEIVQGDLLVGVELLLLLLLAALFHQFTGQLLILVPDGTAGQLVRPLPPFPRQEILPQGVPVQLGIQPRQTQDLSDLRELGV